MAARIIEDVGLRAGNRRATIDYSVSVRYP